MIKPAILVEIAQRHGISKARVVSFSRWGLIDLPGNPVSDQPVKKEEGETVEQFLERFVKDYPALTSRAEAERFREVLEHLWALRKVEMPSTRLEEAHAILVGEGHTNPLSSDYFRLVGGTPASIARWTRERRTGRAEGCPSDLAVQNALGIYRDQFAALVALGILDELREGSPIFGRPIELEGLNGVLYDRFKSLVWTECGIELIRTYHTARRALRLESHSSHPPGVIPAVVNHLVALGQVVTLDVLKHLLAGDVEQLRDYLRTRARAIHDVPMPKRNPRKGATLKELQADAPPELRHAWATALDIRRGSSITSPPPGDIAGILATPHPQVHAVSIVVSLHARKIRKFKSKCALAMRSLRHLAPQLQGTDITDPVAVRIAFTSIRLLAAHGDRFDRRARDEDLRCWRFVVELFEDYRLMKGMPAELAQYLDTIRPALPAGSHEFYKDVFDDLEEFNIKSRSNRIDRIDPILKDIPAFWQTITRERSRFLSFRQSVDRALGEGRKKFPDEELLVIKGHHREKISDTTGGEPIEQEYTFVIRHWRTITAELQELRPHKERYQTVDNGLPRQGWESELFENRFVVEYRGCRSLADNKGISPMPWLALFEKRAFWQPRDVPDDLAFNDRAKWLAGNGLSEDALRTHGRGIGTFESGKNAIARRADRFLGMTLLALEEFNHSQLIGLVNISSRMDNALRSGEIAQFNIGEGLTTGYDENGEPFSIFSAIPKKRQTARDFVISDVTEALTDELLSLASERFYAGKGIEPTPRATDVSKGPDMALHVFTHGERTLRPAQINLHSRILLIGHYDLRGHDLKYVWTRLEKLNGATDDEIQDGHDHKMEQTTNGYDVTLPGEQAGYLALRRDNAQERREWLEGRTPAPVYSKAVDKLAYERRRHEYMIRFYEEFGEANGIARSQLRIRAIDTKMGRLRNQGG